MPNALAHETSPYLRQHADNPVQWLPWGETALTRAREEDKPILLSVGYAACHWCHVMAHESFEDDTTAALMNAHFVNVKVDREERPDVDAIYMRAVQALTGRGGWPMTVFLTPDAKPFYGGTYYPPEDRHGLPGFRRVLASVHQAWTTRRDEVLRGATAMMNIYALDPTAPLHEATPFDAVTERAVSLMRRQYDTRSGGFGGAPKFPPTMALDALLREWARTEDASLLSIVRHSWDRMVGGGLHDQIGGGFHRYTVDDEWLVPHFEKMLYDNALLVRLGAHLWQATGDATVRTATEQALEWLAREMTAPDGAWYASLDADSDGHEGAFYVWNAAELGEVLGADAELLGAYWGVTPHGNFEGKNILWTPLDADTFAERRGIPASTLHGAIDRGRAALLARRSARTRPARDEKIIASWNGLMLRGVAECARIFADERWDAAARRAGTFLWNQLVIDGRARRAWTDGQAPLAGMLEDHAALGLGFLALYELTFDARWLERAWTMSAACVQWFFDGAQYYDTAADAAPLIARPRDAADNAHPSGTSLALELDLRLHALDGDAARRERAERVLERLSDAIATHPLAFGHALGCRDLAQHGAVTVVIAGANAAGGEMLRAAAQRAYVPGLVLAGGEAAAVPLLRDKPPLAGRATAYVCRGFTCDAPTVEPDELYRQLRVAGRH